MVGAKILRGVTQFVKKKKCFCAVGLVCEMFCIDENGFGLGIKVSVSGFVPSRHIERQVQRKCKLTAILIEKLLIVKHSFTFS